MRDGGGGCRVSGEGGREGCPASFYNLTLSPGTERSFLFRLCRLNSSSVDFITKSVKKEKNVKMFISKKLSFAHI